MINFIYNLFKSEETKIDEEYQEYRQKYRDKIKIFRKGDLYGVDESLLNKHRSCTSFLWNSQEIKKRYIEVCKNYEYSLLPVVEM